MLRLISIFQRKFKALKRRLVVSFGAQLRTARKTEASLKAYHINTPVKSDKSHPVVLILGPRRISASAEQSRLKLAEDVFRSLQGDCDIHWLTSVFSPKTLVKAESLCSTYNVVHHISHSPVSLSGVKNISLYQAYRLALDIKPDVITNLSGYLNFGHQAVLIAKALRIRSVLRVPGDEVLAKKIISRKDVKHWQELETEIFGNSDLCMVMSKKEADRVKSISSVAKTRVVIRGVDKELFKFAPIDNAPIKRIKILFIGRNSPEKGTHLLRQILDAADPARFEFTLIGDFSEDDVIWRKARILKFVDQVGISQIHAQSHVLLSCSIMEGYPQVIAEALNTGRPVIIPDDMLNEELEGSDFIFRSPRSVGKYISTLEEVYDQRSELPLMSKSAAEYAGRNLDSKLWETVYRDAIFGTDEL